MKRILILSLLCAEFLFSENLHAQKTPKELGQKSFYYFQKTKLDSFFLLIPTIAEIAEIGMAMGRDTSAPEFKKFVAAYSEKVKKFKERCFIISKDNPERNLSWSKTKLKKIEIKEHKLFIDDSGKSKFLLLKDINVYFTCRTKTFTLRMREAYKFNDIWKLGDNIFLSFD
jgi:hypothetical protein